MVSSLQFSDLTADAAPISSIVGKDLYSTGTIDAEMGGGGYGTTDAYRITVP